MGLGVAAARACLPDSERSPPPPPLPPHPPPPALPPRNAVDAPSLALVVPVIHRGLRDRSGDVKKRAARIVGNLCALINDPRDMAPYVSVGWGGFVCPWVGVGSYGCVGEARE